MIDGEVNGGARYPWSSREYGRRVLAPQYEHPATETSEHPGWGVAALTPPGRVSLRVLISPITAGLGRLAPDCSSTCTAWPEVADATLGEMHDTQCVRAKSLDQ